MKALLSILLVIMFTSFRGQSQKDLHVYVFIGEDCPICNYMGRPLSEIAKKYGERVDFHAVFPVRRSNYKTAQLFKEQYDMMTFETLLDKDLAITKKLGATVTPEVVITDAFGTVLYRGRVNSAYYAPGKMKHSSIQNDLDDALATLLAGGTVPQPWPSPVGCYITMTATRQE